MALGEWLSVQSSRELYEHQIGIEKRELDEMPEEEMAELALIYQAKGVAPDEARRLAERLLSDESPRWTRWPARNSALTRKSWAARPGRRR